MWHVADSQMYCLVDGEISSALVICLKKRNNNIMNVVLKNIIIINSINNSCL